MSQDNPTLEERNAKRADILARYGYDPTIPEKTRDEIRAIVDELWVVTREEFTGFRLSLDVNPRTDFRSRARYDAEGMMMKKYGSDPFRLGTEFSNYRLSFFAN